MDAIAETSETRRGRLRDALRVWTHVSIAGIGGPALQIATMHRLLVNERRWISDERFFHALNYCIAMPGPETQQLAVYVGWLAHRTIGGIVAGGLFILPGVACMMALCFGYVEGATSQIGQAVFLGVKPAIFAIITEAVLRFGRHVLRGRWMVALAALAFVAAFFFKLSFLIIVFGAAVIGVAAGWARLPGFTRPLPHPVHDLGAGHEYEELPDHTRPSRARLVRSLALWLALWLAPVIALIAILGLQNVYTQIALLFSKIALMAFGGDFAVIAYAAQQIVDSHHWLSAREMQDGIALGEMVPGSIIIVTQFVGFLVAYRDPGALPPLVAGTLGGLLATWVTFMPCFLWIFVVAPFIEGLRDNAFLNAALRAVTAAAIGMIADLSAWFGIRTLFHNHEAVRLAWLTFDVPNPATLDPWALVLFVGAVIAVFRFKVSAAATLIASSAVGVTLFLLGLTG
jgi:chromate transporter